MFSTTCPCIKWLVICSNSCVIFLFLFNLATDRTQSNTYLKMLLYYILTSEIFSFVH